MEGKEKESKHHKLRLKGLFSKEKKAAAPEQDVDDFLHGSSDKLNFPAPSPTAHHQLPRLARIDTASARRWPTAAEIQNSKLTRGRSASPKRNKRRLVVRFSDEKPAIIGEGGDEAELPSAEISRRNQAHTYSSRDQRSADHGEARHSNHETVSGRRVGDTDQLRPGPMRRTQTGYESISDNGEGRGGGQGASGFKSTQAERFETDHHHPKSFNARVKAEMMAGEGKALLHASSDFGNEQSLHDGSFSTGSHSHLDEVQRNTLSNISIPPPPGVPSQLIPGRRITSQASQQSTFDLGDISTANSRTLTSAAPVTSPPAISRVSKASTVVDSPEKLLRSSTLTIHEATLALGDDALKEFTARVAHLFTLFQLSAESIQPFSKSPLEELVRAAMWWFLRGRMNLEATVRDRPSSPEGQKTNFSDRQQAYADLAKSLWLIEMILPQNYELPNNHNTLDPSMADILEVRDGILSSLRKLAISMKRNDYLPPEDAPLPQGIDSSIWGKENGDISLLASQKQATSMTISVSMALGDSSRYFQYGRLFARGSLVEDGDSQQYQTPTLVSLVRNRKEDSLSMVVTSQNGSLGLCIQADKSHGPSWADVEWHAKSSVIGVRLPRGFRLDLQCPQNDFRTLWGMYDYQKKLFGDFKEKENEGLVFESTLESFQYFSQDGNSPFPKEPIAQCRLKVFETLIVEKAATGIRRKHRGLRMGLITSPATKVLRGLNQEFSSEFPIQFGFLRGDGGLPAFLLKVDGNTLKYTMVFTFRDVKERSILHSQLTGIALRGGEAVVAEAQMESFKITEPQNEQLNCLKVLEWQSVRVINEDFDDPQSSKNVLSDNLRVVMDFKIGSFTDRFNVGPGELKIRLDVISLNELKILRQPQQDMTLSVVESQAPKKLSGDLAELLGAIAKAETTRTYRFPSPEDLHLFQTAITGFSVMFDGMATAFNISRRRMVVPIYKKWDAQSTRLQVVQREKSIQLVAFFENFNHGDSMSFALKSTDTFESSSKSGKFSLRIVDAKFALPKKYGEGEASAEKGFVCLDLQEYPAEHDDITIVFDTEAEREKFVKGGKTCVLIEPPNIAEASMFYQLP